MSSKPKKAGRRPHSKPEDPTGPTPDPIASVLAEHKKVCTAIGDAVKQLAADGVPVPDGAKIAHAVFDRLMDEKESLPELPPEPDAPPEGGDEVPPDEPPAE